MRTKYNIQTYKGAIAQELKDRFTLTNIHYTLQREAAIQR
jgi:hypothetical protein